MRLQKDQATRATLEVVHRPLEGIGGMSPSLSNLSLRGGESRADR